ncbi:MAG: type II secretion system F family protein [Verrucomicrobiae bacterium]|nr:type II secretion system F family protein [Verrucomicrobiae bacterium]
MPDPLQIISLMLMGIGVVLGVYGGVMSGLEKFHSYEENYVQRTEQDLYAMFNGMSPRKFLYWSIICYGGVFGLVVVIFGDFSSFSNTGISLVFAALAGIPGFMIPRVMLKRMSRNRMALFEQQLLDALQSMSNSLRAGFSILQSFESVVQQGRNPIAQEFGLFLHEIRVGVKFETAIDNLARRMPSEDLQIVIVGIETARQTGGNLTEMFDRLSTVIRERLRVQGRIQSLTAMGKLQGWLVALMVPGLAFGVYYLQPAMMMGFMRSGMGLALVGLVAFLVLIGALIMRKIVNIDV